MSPEERSRLEELDRIRTSLVELPPVVQLLVRRLDAGLKGRFVGFDIPLVATVGGRWVSPGPEGAPWGELIGATSVGVWWNDVGGSTHLMTWRRVLAEMDELEATP